MAFQLLDGTVAGFDFVTSVNTADVTAANTANASSPSLVANGNSWKCVTNELSITITQSAIDKTTFCTGRWPARTAGRRDIRGSIGLIESQGLLVSNPMYMFGTPMGIPMQATLATNWTFTANIMAAERRLQARAYDNYQGGMDWMIDATYIAPAFIVPTS